MHVCEAPEESDISPDGHEAWVGCRHSNESGIVDLTQKKMTASFRPWPSTPDDPTADSTRRPR